MRWVHAMVALLFAVMALLQLNDLDPIGWVSIYLAGTAVAAMAAVGYRPPWRRPLAIAVAAAAVAWALVIAFTSPANPPLGALIGDWQMRQAGIEERRETLGLLFLALWSSIAARPPAGRASSRG